MPLLVEQVNEAIRDKTRHIDAIAKGYDQPSLHARVEELEQSKAKLENMILALIIKIINSYRVPYRHISLKPTC
jgi:hypothetical protein